jgi:hypothetical protein
MRAWTLLAATLMIGATCADRLDGQSATPRSARP